VGTTVHLADSENRQSHRAAPAGSLTMWPIRLNQKVNVVDGSEVIAGQKKIKVCALIVVFQVCRNS